MLEIGIESSILDDIKTNQKTIEARLKKGKFLDLKVGTKLSLREDIWKNNEIISSKPTKIEIEITRVDYFDSFKDILSAINYKKIIPKANSMSEAVEAYSLFYTEADEKHFGVIAFTFKVLKS